MAITWTVDIAVTDLVSRSISIAATRTDTGVIPTKVRSYNAVGKYDTVSMTPQQLLTHYTNLFWDLYQAEITRETQVATLVGQAKTALTNALQAKEI